ncbi:aminotransferase class III-fold pyridoxal phosphate-dependent enzyme [Pseudomonas sp. SAR267]
MPGNRSSFIRGSGARLWDAEGNEYLDAISGVAATDLGHSHPVITAHNRS